MESNKTDDYCIAVRVLKDGMLLNVKDDVFYKYFEGNKEEEFKLKFIEKDNAPVRLPDIKDTYILEKLISNNNLMNHQNTFLITIKVWTQLRLLFYL